MVGPLLFSHVLSPYTLQVRYFTGYGLVALIEDARVSTKAAVERVAGVVIIGIKGIVPLTTVEVITPERSSMSSFPSLPK
jgi:hypothetical protein